MTAAMTTNERRTTNAGVTCGLLRLDTGYVSAWTRLLRSRPPAVKGAVRNVWELPLKLRSPRRRF